MSGSQTKKLRNEIRGAVQEMLSEVLMQEAYVELNKHIRSRLEQISLEVKESLDKMDSRQKDTQNMLVRAISEAQAPKVAKSE